MDSRHQQRIKIVQQLFANQYDSKQNLNLKSKQVLKNRNKLDKYIQNNAPKYKIDKIAHVDLAILRLALFEMLIEQKQPNKVIINEAIELAKELGGNNSPAFINAVLGKIYEQSLNLGK